MNRQKLMLGALMAALWFGAQLYAQTPGGISTERPAAKPSERAAMIKSGERKFMQKVAQHNLYR